MDCGEGTYGQMVRLLGAPECEKMLRKLVAVYVSHLHADHHIGFIRLLHARRKAFHAAGVFDVSGLTKQYNFKENFLFVRTQTTACDDVKIQQTAFIHISLYLINVQ